VPVSRDLDLEHTLDRALLATIVCKFGGDPAICLREEAIFVKSQRCPYHVTFDLDLEHTLDAGSSGDHRVQVWWRSSHFCSRRSDLRKVYRRTDRRRRTPHDCISSWNELKMNICITGHATIFKRGWKVVGNRRTSVLRICHVSLIINCSHNTKQACLQHAGTLMHVSLLCKVQTQTPKIKLSK